MNNIIKLAIEKQYVISKLKKEAKLLHREQPEQSLMACQDFIAREHGYLHWHELHTLVKNKLLNIHKNNLITNNKNDLYIGTDSLIKQKLYLEPNFGKLYIYQNEETRAFSSQLFKNILNNKKSQLIYCYNNDNELVNNLEDYSKQLNIKLYHIDFINNDSNFYFDLNNMSSGSLTQLLYSLVISINGSGSDMWAGRAVSFIAALNMALVYMSDYGEIELTPQFIMDSLQYSNIVTLSNRKDFPHHIQAALKAYLRSLDTFGNYDSILEHHGHLQMQYMKVLGNITHNHSKLFEKNSKKHRFSEIIQSQGAYIIVAKFPNSTNNIHSEKNFCFNLFSEYWKTHWEKFNTHVEKSNLIFSSYFCADNIGQINMRLPSDRLSQPINFITIDSHTNIQSYSDQSTTMITPLNNEQIIIK